MSDSADPLELKALSAKLDAAMAQIDELAARSKNEMDNSMMPMSPLDDDGFQTWIPSSGGGVTGFFIYRAGVASGSYIPLASAMLGYDADTDDHWSLEFAVTSSALDEFAGAGDPYVWTNPIGVDDGDGLWDGDASADPVEDQEYYRIPLVRDGVVVCQGGVFRENIMCAGSKGPIVELVRIG